MPATIIAAVDNSPASLQAARLLAGYQGERSRLAVVILNVQSRPFTLWPGPAIDARAVDAALLSRMRPSAGGARALSAGRRCG